MLELEHRRARRIARARSQLRADLFFSGPPHARVLRTGEALALRIGTLALHDAPRANIRSGH